MTWRGHEVVKINSRWSFDKTEFIGYRTRTNKLGELVGPPIKAFKIIDRNRDGNFEFSKYMEGIPLGVLRKSTQIIKAYYKEALICDAECIT